MSLFSKKQIILASKSKARKHLLKSAGLKFTCQPSSIDEDTIKTALLNSEETTQVGDIAEILAQAKAVDISERNKGGIIIGGDQTMSCEGLLFSKAKSMEEAKDNLFFLRGKTHTLHSAVCVAVDGEIIWSHCDEAHLSMITFSNEFLGAYLAEMGDDILTTVGGYQLENKGSLLFEKIDGDYHTILGLPLLSLLNFLRSKKLILE